MDRLDYELEIVSLLEEACSKLNSKEFETLITRVMKVIIYYK